MHRDPKPSNILLETLTDSDGKNSGHPTDSRLSALDFRPRVMDFGLARRDEGEITVTIEGQVLGTPAYMSPEQARGESHRVDGSELTAEQADQRQTWINEALTSLKMSIDKGWSDFAHLQHDPDLTILRELPEFQALVPKTQEPPTNPKS